MLIPTVILKEVFPVKMVFELSHERSEDCLEPALRQGTPGEGKSERKGTAV